MLLLLFGSLAVYYFIDPEKVIVFVAGWCIGDFIGWAVKKYKEYS